jgi:hypothetical protein
VDTGLLCSAPPQRIFVAGNRFHDCELSAVELGNLLPGAENVLIANNTMHHNVRFLGIRDDSKKGYPGLKCQKICFQNNLVLDPVMPADLFFFDHPAGDPGNLTKGGDMQKLLDAWRFSHNWREITAPPDGDPNAAFWIPGPRDTLKKPIPDLSTRLDTADFLRPPKGSPLATTGAGGSDAEICDRDLPPYVGAVPPVGVEPWDWEKTWKARVGANVPMAIPNVLTVAKNGTGQFQTIGEALAKVKPGMTIRVLDDAVYQEALAIDDPERHTRITVEASHGATLALIPACTSTLAIDSIAGVTVRGFRFKSDAREPVRGAMLLVTGPCPGLRLEGLVLEGTGINGMWLKRAWSPDREQPIVVMKCTVKVKADGIVVFGECDERAKPRTGRIAIRENTVLGSWRGLLISGGAADVHLMGNVVRNCKVVGIQIEDPYAGLSGILIANNTVQRNMCGFRVWDYHPFKTLTTGQVRVTNNLLVDNLEGDTYYLCRKDRAGNEEQQPGDGKMLIKTWTFAHNWRDLAGNPGRYEIPLTADDRIVSELEIRLSPPQRPSKDSPLATGGAGGDLPGYVGALPPEGVAPWDWDNTWKARVRPGKD